MILVDFYQDDGNADASGEAIQAKVYPLPSFVRVILTGFGGESIRSADNEGADKAAVDDARGLAEDYSKIGILLVQDIDGTDSLLLRNQGFDSFFVTVQGDAKDGCVPLLAQIGRHLCDDEGFAHFVRGVDALNTTFLVTGDLIDYFCHI